MHLCAYRIKNYRRLRDIRIELAADISIFVGSNNSGKTSATQALYAFTSGSKDSLSLFDFSSSCWKDFDELGNLPQEVTTQRELPSISLDLWFEVAASDLYLVIPLLPSTAWQGSQVGIRIEFAARNQIELLNNFHSAHLDAETKASALEKRENEQYVPWPKSLTDYLKNELLNEFEFRYFALDRDQFDEIHKPKDGYKPTRMGKEPGGGFVLKSLITVENLSAQRHLADSSSHSGPGKGRSEDLSKRLSRFYKRNLDQRQEDHRALRALFDSEIGLNEHLADVFKDTLSRLSVLGYPGLNNPKLEIKSALNPAAIMSTQDARVHYVLGDGKNDIRLPDTYNGLGFKNLIYMVVEILDLHAKWVANKKNRTPLQLICIEEPEAHLHAQLQQVFIRHVLELVKDPGGDSAFHTQIVITTHSPHILYERGFQPVRYFRRKRLNGEQTTEVLNLSAFYNQVPGDRDFLQRYLKLTHCDLFFADAAILVEGNVERLLLPVMIEKEAPTLSSVCLSILEVGGAFGHKFKSLIEFLGLVTLVITDLDSVALVSDASESNEDDDIEFQIPATEANQPLIMKIGKTCLPSQEDALTSNQTLIQWLPKKQTVADLFSATEVDKLHQAEDGQGFKAKVTYQLPNDVTWNGATEHICGRTLEEAFGLENADLCQDAARRHIGLKLRTNPLTPQELATGLHKRVTGRSFDKTRFALAVLTELPASWKVPSYIKNGLHWLSSEVSLELPVPLPETTEPAAAAAAPEVIVPPMAAQQ